MKKSFVSRIVDFRQSLSRLCLSINRLLLGLSKPSDCPCEIPALKKPDPLIYCQYYLLSLGIPVTWDNPDIFVYEGTTLVDPHDLKASTTYTVAARIWNNSTDIPVMNLKVYFSYLSFGVATKSNPIGVSTTDLSVKGLPGCPAFAYMNWTTPATQGHYCIQVLLEPPDDSNWLNNLGQRNVDIAQPKSPAVFTFAVGNHDSPRYHTVSFTKDAYTIPPLPPCTENKDPAGAIREPSKIFTPLPEGWIVAIAPERMQLAPGDEQQVQVMITPPAGFTGLAPVNITAWDGARPLGGVTLNVEVL